MSLRDLMGTTSRHAIYQGVTNSDQIPLQQARAPQPTSGAEVLDDVDHGAPAGGDGGGDVNEATGLTAEEQAEFDRMASGADDPEPPPAGDDVDDTDPADGDDDVDPAAGDAPPLARPGPQKTPAELAAEAAAGKRQAPKTVSYGKYQRELKAAKEAATNAQANATKEREDRIKLAERVAIINEALTAQAAAPPPVDQNAPPANPFDEEDIDPTVDYAESVKQIQRRQRFQMDNQSRVEQDVVESREDREMRDTFQRDFSVEWGKDANLPAAYQFLKDSRLTEICISEFDKDPYDPNVVFTKDEVAKMVQMFNAEEKWVVGNAIKQNKSPSAAIMKLARARGFKAAAARAPASAAPPAPRNGAPARPAAPAAPAAPSAAAELAALAEAKEAGKSLSDGGGAPPSGLSAEILLSMSDDEFADMVDSLPKHQLDALMGRAG